MNPKIHPFTLRQLQYLVAVADALSFRKAADQCHVSQPSLSMQIAQCENALGITVFERDRQHVLLTPTGRDVVERARNLLLEADDLAESVLRAGNPLEGRLRLGVIPTVSPYLLPILAPALKSQFRKLIITWSEDKTDALLKELQAGHLDALLLALEAPLGEVLHEVVGKDRFVLAAAPNHALMKTSGPVSRPELRGVDVLLLDEGHCFREQALAFCTSRKARELEFRATSLPTLVQMVASSTGVTLLPSLAVPTEARRSGLKTRPFADPAPGRTIVLAWRRRSPLTAALRQLAEVMRDAYPAPALAHRSVRQKT